MGSQCFVKQSATKGQVHKAHEVVVSALSVFATLWQERMITLKTQRPHHQKPATSCYAVCRIAGERDGLVPRLEQWP